MSTKYDIGRRYVVLDGWFLSKITMVNSKFLQLFFIAINTSLHNIHARTQKSFKCMNIKNWRKKKLRSVTGFNPSYLIPCTSRISKFFGESTESVQSGVDAGVVKDMASCMPPSLNKNWSFMFMLMLLGIQMPVMLQPEKMDAFHSSFPRESLFSQASDVGQIRSTTGARITMVDEDASTISNVFGVSLFLLVPSSPKISAFSRFSRMATAGMMACSQKPF